MSIYKTAKNLSYQKQNIAYIYRQYPFLSHKKCIIVLNLSWYLYEKRKGRNATHYLSWIFEDI